jgi:hypothetical protein
MGEKFRCMDGRFMFVLLRGGHDILRARDSLNAGSMIRYLREEGGRGF